MEQLQPWRGFGQHGVIHDTVGEALPVGAWTDARNVRFSGVEMEKMLEPTLRVELPFTGALLEQGWNDGVCTYVAVATSTELWFFRSDGPSSDDQEWVLAGSGYDPEGEWQAFPWGDTVIFNNGVNPPQIFDSGSISFIDLPGWGLISTADDITNGDAPSKDTKARCKVLLPYKGFLVACGITEGGYYQPNTIWWSGVTRLAGLATAIDGSGPPDWDYESPASLSGKMEVGAGDGEIRAAARLNENVIAYTDRSAIAVTAVGGTAVMQSRRLFNKGCAGLHLVQEFNNRHYVVARDQLYIHDGSTVELIAKDRVEDEFFRRAGKGGRYRGGDLINYSSMQLAKDPLRKELWLAFDDKSLPNAAREDGVPLLPPVISARLLYAEELETTDTRYPEGKLWVVGNKIMVNAGGLRLVYSPDLGATWIDLGNTPNPNSNSQISRIQHRPDTGQGEAWFVELEDDDAHEAYRYFTTDLGQNWTAVSDGGYDGYASATMLIDSENRFVFAGRSSPGSALAGNVIARIDNPLVSNSINASAVFDSVVNTDNLRETNGGYVVSIWDGDDDFERDLAFIPYALTTHQDYGWEAARDDDAVMSQNYVDPDGISHLLVGRTNTDRLEVWTQGVLGSPPPTLEPDWGEATGRYRANANSRYITAVSIPDAGDDDRWLVTLGDRPVASSFGPASAIKMPTPVDNTRKFHLQNAFDDTWIGYYTEENYVRVVLFTFGTEIPTRTGLVWNFEDNNYTWADVSAADEEVGLRRVPWIDYRFDAGWLTRYSSDLVDGRSYAYFDTPRAPWSEGGTPPRYSDMARPGREQSTYWLTDSAIYEADQEVYKGILKYCFVERTQFDLDDLNPSWTTNNYKYLDQFVFHLQTPYPVDGTNTFKISAGWSDNLMDTPEWTEFDEIVLAPVAQNGKYKWDVRTSGRYLALRMDFAPTEEIRMTGADVAVEPMYGR